MNSTAAFAMNVNTVHVTTRTTATCVRICFGGAAVLNLTSFAVARVCAWVGCCFVQANTALTANFASNLENDLVLTLTCRC